jgi:ribosomal protein L11 methyltransferase
MRAWPALELSRLDSVRSHGFAEAGVEPNGLVQAFLLDYNIAAIEELSTGVWRVFFQDAESRDRARDALPREFGQMSVVAVEVEDGNWAARSQADLRAVEIGRIIVAPPWDLPPSPPEQSTVIVIEPSTGFGTGHHPTTRLCLRAMQQLALADSSVIDVGTGSGILAIAASRLGARHVLAIDSDPDALRTAASNVARNGVMNVTLRLADLRTLFDDPRQTPRAAARQTFDVLVANLTGTLLATAAGQLQALTGPEGRMILSGFTRSEVEKLVPAFVESRIENREEEEEWVCVTVKRSLS